MEDARERRVSDRRPGVQSRWQKRVNDISNDAAGVRRELSRVTRCARLRAASA